MEFILLDNVFAPQRNTILKESTDAILQMLTFYGEREWLYCVVGLSFSTMRMNSLVFLSLVITAGAYTNAPGQHIHTLLLCRHGNSIWNGGQEGFPERFTGWTDCPLSDKGELEAHEAAHQLSTYFRDIDVCFTSTLHRAQHTADICLAKLKDKNQFPRTMSDARLNERHYGALQGLIKKDVEDGVYGHPAHKVEQWRRSWYARPPPMDAHDERYLQQVSRHGLDAPNGESLQMVAENRVRPFLKKVLIPTLNSMANDDHPTTGLVVAHANSLRALIGVMCNVQNNRKALRVLESLKIPTGVPLVMHVTTTTKYGRAMRLPEPDECVVQDVNGWVHRPQQPPPNLGHESLPVWPLDACIPLMDPVKHQTQPKKKRYKVPIHKQPAYMNR